MLEPFYGTRMEIDPVLEQRALEAAVAQYPSMRAYAAHAHLRFLPLPGGGGAFMLRYDPALPPGLADAWEFQNTTVRTYQSLAGVGTPRPACEPR